MADLAVLSKANHEKKTAPIKIMQFGEGNFLRAFIDWMIQTMNDSGKYEGHVVVVQPLEMGRVADLAKQDGLYTLILQGLNEKGEAVRTHQVIDVLDDFVNPFVDYQKFLKYGESKDLEVVISNTTEAGIAFDEKDVDVDITKVVPNSYPGKLYALLYRRYKTLGPKAGLAIMPCELIDDNGDHLKEVLLELASKRHEEAGFAEYLAKACHYTSSLVDRIVPGFPRDEFPALCQEFGYIDNSMVKGEYFHLYVLKKEAYCQKHFPVDKFGLHAIYVDDVHPYKKRKVRILNGAHTSLVPVAYLSGFNEVRESLLDPEIKKFLLTELYNEIVPTITTKDAKDFADAVISRFLNPYVHHALMSIALNSISKYKERDLPTVLDDLKAGKDPKHLLFALAALIKFYDGYRIKNGQKEAIALKDTPEYLVEFRKYWDAYYAGGKLDLEGYKRMLKELCVKYGFKGAATSLRESHSASDNGWSCAMVVDGKFYSSKHYEIRIVDRVGAGDSFSGGLIYGLTHYANLQSAIEFAAAASALKHTIPGDFNHVSVKEVETLMGGDASGRVQR